MPSNAWGALYVFSFPANVMGFSLSKQMTPDLETLNYPPCLSFMEFVGSGTQRTYLLSMAIPFFC